MGSLLRVPFAGRNLLAVVVELTGSSELADDRLSEPHALLPSGLPGDLVELALWMGREYCSTPARALGLMLPPSIRSGAAERRVLVARITPAGHAAVEQEGRLTPGQRAALTRLVSDGATPAAQLGIGLLRRLERRGLLTLKPTGVRRRPHTVAVGARSAHPPPLTAPQAAALSEITAALQVRRGNFLLQGVTGSGKTEIYLGAVQAALAAGRGAIVLVPEIALTPQVLGRFQARFGDVVAVLHSGLRPGERHDEWVRLRTGQARVCVGPRSAVLAPVRDLGLIVIDEEHDGSYKHEGDPRYDARTVASRRAALSGAVMVFGSATPRPESVHGLRRLRLEHRIDGRELPHVEVLDMRGQHHPLHPTTRLALADLRRAGEKAIVLLNRRGWSNFLTCRSCGRVWSCPNCEVALVLHRADRPFVACHHCGHRELVPERCEECTSPAVARHGAGTQRLEHELAAALGATGFPIFRLDADTHGDRVAEVLTGFEAACAGVLVGTQMVAKGHDFPDVSLGVVLDADQTLRFPDFRAEERTFALITQLAGRAGRGDPGARPPRVLVQTLAPLARSIRLAANHDADGFVAEEVEHRRALGYPPFGTLIRVVCASADPTALDSVAGELKRGIDPRAGAVLGPAPLFRLRGRHRRQLLLKSTEREAAIAAVGPAVQAVAAGAGRRGVAISVDVDPQ